MVNRVFCRILDSIIVDCTVNIELFDAILIRLQMVWRA